MSPRFLKNGAALLWIVLLAACGPESIVGQVVDLRHAGQRSHQALELWQQGKFEEAIRIQEDVLETAERVAGPASEIALSSANNLAVFYREQGRLAEAEALLEKTVVRAESAFGPDAPLLAEPLNNLGGVLGDLAAYSDAETALERSLGICEESADRACIAGNLNDLALLYGCQGRNDEAEAYLQRALAIAREAIGEERRDTAIALNNLAAFYMEQGLYDRAEPVYLEAIEVLEAVRGETHPDTATALSNLANLYQQEGRFEEAEPYFQRAIAIRRERLGETHPDLATTLNNYAVMLQKRGDLEEAGRLFRQVLTLRENSLGPEHPLTTATLANLSGVMLSKGELDEARRLMTKVIERSGARVAGGRAGHRTEQEAGNLGFRAEILLELITFQDSPSKSELVTAFEAMQWATRDTVGATADKALVAFADGTGELARLARERSLLEQQLDAAERKTVRLAQAADDAALASARGEMQRVRDRFEHTTAELVDRFPAFADLVGGKPLPLSRAQAVLGPREGLLLIGMFAQPELERERTPAFSMLVTPDTVRLRKLDHSEQELAARVKRLRSQLDPGSGGGLRSGFDFAAAYELFDDLLAAFGPPFERLDHLYVVPDGALESLPLSVLVTAPPDGVEDYGEAPWLVRRLAMSTLASAASLEALKTFVGPAGGNSPFLGIGDPALDGREGDTRGLDASAYFEPDGTSDVRALRNLVPLPETADELRTVAASLSAGEGALLLGRAASEERLSRIDLADHRIIAFATHGLIAGQIDTLAEPALVLTPPLEATGADDGLLSASEISQLSLDADLVMLSACNTAAPDGSPGAPGLSGLAKAFIHAGARALLVSHWEVYSFAAQALTTGMIKAELAAPEIGHAEALRRSMLAMLDHPRSPDFAHPSVWAPFVIVGDGRASIQRQNGAPQP